MKKVLFFCLTTLVSFSAFSQMRITEWEYNGSANAEFIEFTNVGNAPINMTGWSFDDADRVPGAMSLSAFGTVQPGESVVLCEASAANFRTAWNLCAGIKIIGGNSNNLGRSDEINLYNNSGTLMDRLTYNDQGSGSVKGPRTDGKSAWVPLSALGANNASLWVASVNNDGEGSYLSTGGDIGSPGKSTRATVVYNPCPPSNSAPTIVIDVAATSNFLDGGALSSPVSPYGISGVISDPTDPAKTLGISFTIADPNTPVANLTVTASSSNISVVPSGNLNLTGSGASRNIKITPLGVGYSNITITVNDGSLSASYVLNYAASAAAAVPANTSWHTGISDGSTALALDDNYYICADDELNLLNVYSRMESGLPLKTYDYTSNLSLPDPSKPEVDVEASVRSIANPSKIYWLGSMSNGKGPSFDDKPNRNRLFATTVSGTGSLTSFSFSGYYGNLRARLISWGDANGYNFSSSAVAGVDSKAINGFAAEGVVFAPDNTTLYIGLRAPLVPTANRTKAVIAPIVNFEAWFNNGSPAGNPTFGAPIELNLGNRGIREMIRLSNGTYLIIAGNYAGSPINGAVYKWTGNPADAPVLVNSAAATSLPMEGAMQVNVSGQLSLSKLQVISDLGDGDLYNDGSEAKDLGDLNLRKFRSDNLDNLDLSLCQLTATLSANGSTSFCQGQSVVLSANGGMSAYLWSNGATTQTISVSTPGNYSVTITHANGCSATSTVIAIVVNPLPAVTISAGGSTSLCPGQSVLLTASGSTGSYLWSNSATTNTVLATAPGNYSVTVTDANSCSNSSNVITINNYTVASSSTTITSCDTYVWNATTYTTSGIYTYTTQNATGCDSTAVLNLTINHGTNSSSTVTACNNYVWNATTYTTSGVYTYTTQNATGCDSTVVLNLTINHSTTSTSTVAACDTYVWNASTYTTSGIYTYTTQNSAGCDSIATLDLTIHVSPLAPVISPAGTQTFCPAGSLMLSGPASMSVYAWSNGAASQTIGVNAKGSYSLQVTDMNGCVSPFSSPVLVSNGLPSDINKDGKVNVDDFLLFAPKFGFNCTCGEDINEDGRVDVDDFLLFAPAFGRTCQ